MPTAALLEAVALWPHLVRLFQLCYAKQVKTRPGICQKKRRFASREAADAAALAADVPLRTYKCGLCHQFHLTSRTKGLRPPRSRLS